MQEIGQIGEEAVRRIIRTVQECGDVVKYHRRIASKQTIKSRKQRNERIGSIGHRRNVYKYWKQMTVYSPGDGSYYNEKPKGETDQN